MVECLMSPAIGRSLPIREITKWLQSIRLPVLVWPLLSTEKYRQLIAKLLCKRNDQRFGQHSKDRKWQMSWAKALPMVGQSADSRKAHTRRKVSAFRRTRECIRINNRLIIITFQVQPSRESRWIWLIARNQLTHLKDHYNCRLSAGEGELRSTWNAYQLNIH